MEKNANSFPCLCFCCCIRGWECLFLRLWAGKVQSSNFPLKWCTEGRKEGEKEGDGHLWLIYVHNDGMENSNWIARFMASRKKQKKNKRNDRKKGKLHCWWRNNHQEEFQRQRKAQKSSAEKRVETKELTKKGKNFT